MVVEDWELPCQYLVHDWDTSFAALDGVLKTDELHILKMPPHAPLCNAYAEQHVREIRETLDNLILLGPASLAPLPGRDPGTSQRPAPALRPGQRHSRGFCLPSRASAR